MYYPLQRQFYVEMARVERWSVRTLRQKVQGMLYERTAISLAVSSSMALLTIGLGSTGRATRLKRPMRSWHP